MAPPSVMNNTNINANRDGDLDDLEKGLLPGEMNKVNKSKQDQPNIKKACALKVVFVAAACILVGVVFCAGASDDKRSVAGGCARGRAGELAMEMGLLAVSTGSAAGILQGARIVRACRRRTSEGKLPPARTGDEEGTEEDEERREPLARTETACPSLVIVTDSGEQEKEHLGHLPDITRSIHQQCWGHLSPDQKIDPEFVKAAFRAAGDWVPQTEAEHQFLCDDGEELESLGRLSLFKRAETAPQLSETATALRRLVQASYMLYDLFLTLGVVEDENGAIFSTLRVDPESCVALFRAILLNFPGVACYPLVDAVCALNSIKTFPASPVAKEKLEAVLSREGHALCDDIPEPFRFLQKMIALRIIYDLGNGGADEEYHGPTPTTTRDAARVADMSDVPDGVLDNIFGYAGPSSKLSATCAKALEVGERVESKEDGQLLEVWKMETIWGPNLPLLRQDYGLLPLFRSGDEERVLEYNHERVLDYWTGKFNNLGRGGIRDRSTVLRKAFHGAVDASDLQLAMRYEFPLDLRTIFEATSGVSTPAARKEMYRDLLTTYGKFAAPETSEQRDRFELLAQRAHAAAVGEENFAALRVAECMGLLEQGIIEQVLNDWEKPDEWEVFLYGTYPHLCMFQSECAKVFAGYPSLIGRCVSATMCFRWVGSDLGEEERPGVQE